ncbi:helix-turn-helix domain-containing protein [Phycisphaerales bacterium AB-hyl4]|uniref:Helix-turn-helix domain-containing protein n=1 Tax=Natronomicrosphaera hydrolytica TaxID=3242702 RepID=A0ABV4U1U0_9BACT
MAKLPATRINHPCGRLVTGVGWGRSRENSLNLRDYELWFVWRGAGWMATRTQRFELRPGFCAWMRPGGIYDAGSDDRNPLGFTYIHFAGRFAQPPPEFFHVSDVSYMDAATRRIVEGVVPAPPTRWGEPADAPPAAEALLQAVLLDLMHSSEVADVRRDDHSLRARVEELAVVLRDHPEHPLDVAGAARRAGVSLSHFSREFRRVIGLSPQQYRLRTRLSHAQHLLAESGLTVTQIAEMLGYRDLFFFSKQFTRHLGVSPTAYRNSLQHLGVPIVRH